MTLGRATSSPYASARLSSEEFCLLVQGEKTRYALMKISSCERYSYLRVVVICRVDMPQFILVHRLRRYSRAWSGRDDWKSVGMTFTLRLEQADIVEILRNYCPTLMTKSLLFNVREGKEVADLGILLCPGALAPSAKACPAVISGN